MTDKQTPADWVLIEAAKRGGYSPEFRWLKGQYEDNPLFRALCDMIERYETPPVDRKVLCAREALRVMIYETTHLSPMEPDGSHWCRITADALNTARAALGESHD